jgi:aspartyl-tRNA(Asn)/glutamyl-tRNA(Gln) amidotransferase subunit C
MSNISTIQVKKTANLARLGKDLSEEQAAVFQSQLNPIIAIADQLQSVDTGNIQPLDGWRTNHIDDLREDISEFESEEYQRIRLNILKNFPKMESNLLVVPGIFEAD